MLSYPSLVFSVQCQLNSTRLYQTSPDRPSISSLLPQSAVAKGAVVTCSRRCLQGMISCSGCPDEHGHPLSWDEATRRLLSSAPKSPSPQAVFPWLQLHHQDSGAALDGEACLRPAEPNGYPTDLIPMKKKRNRARVAKQFFSTEVTSSGKM